MKKPIILALLTIVLLLPAVFAGCQSGVPGEKYDELSLSYQNALAQLEELNNQVASLNSQVEADRAAIQAKDDKLAYYESEIANLRDQYDLTGATPTETAEKIVKYYHDTHIYSSYDLFVCSDMATEVWNMLKAAGINSIVVVGNKDTPISDILQSNHAWVLAEIEPGQYLALETTAGHSVYASQNNLYYKGWSFDSPADLQADNDLRKEYNIRVGFRNLLASEVNKAIDSHNEAVFDKLSELMTDQETILNDIKAQIYSLAAVLQ